MTSTVRQIAYRLKSDGKAEVIRDAREVGDAYRASYGQAEAGANAASAAADRQEQRYRKLAQAARDAAQADAAQSRYNAALGVNPGVAGSARDSAAVFVAQADAMEDAERRARALRAMLDPLGSAQDRLNDELREYDRLAKAGQISTTELAQAQRLARQRFDEQSAAIERNSRGLTRLQVASRLNLARQGADVAVTAAMGMNPAMIAIQQGPQILDALATSGIKARAALLLMGGALTAAAAGAAVAAMAWMDADKAASRLERVTTGMGRTAGLTAREVEALSHAQAANAEISIKAARDQAAAYLATGDVGEESLKRLIAIGKDYASFMGVEATEATKQLADAMDDPLKAGERLTDMFGLLTLKQLDQIEAAMKVGDQARAQQILLDALSTAMDGHAQKVDTVTNAWDALGRGISNAITKFGEWLYVTKAEKVERLDSSIANARASRVPEQYIAQRVAERNRLAAEIKADEDRATAAAAQGRRNQQAYQARERAEEAARNRRRPRSDRSAEREAREQRQRERREQDRRTEIELETAKARQDVDRVRALNDEIALRTRIRQLVDDGRSEEQARTQALSEQAQLLSARAMITERETGSLFRANSIEVDRVLGMVRYNREAEKSADLHERIKDYVEAGQTYYAAWLKAASDQLNVEEARAEVLERIVRSAEREHRLRLAQLGGRDAEARALDRAGRADARAREIEQREGLNYGEGDRRAGAEINAEVAAEAEGVRRAWIKDFVSDIRRSGIGDAVADQLNKATDRMLDKLIDTLMSVDWSQLFKSSGTGGSIWDAIFNRGGVAGEGAKGGGAASFLSSVASAIFGGFGRNAQGTDYWRGGLTWVGERGPELLDLPRGARVTEHNRSMQLAVASGTPAPPVNHYYFQGNLMTAEFWAKIQKGDQQAARQGASQGAQSAVGFIQGTAGEVQRGERMLKN